MSKRGSEATATSRRNSSIRPTQTTPQKPKDNDTVRQFSPFHSSPDKKLSESTRPKSANAAIKQKKISVNSVSPDYKKPEKVKNSWLDEENLPQDDKKAPEIDYARPFYSPGNTPVKQKSPPTAKSNYDRPDSAAVSERSHYSPRRDGLSLEDFPSRDNTPVAPRQRPTQARPKSAVATSSRSRSVLFPSNSTKEETSLTDIDSSPSGFISRTAGSTRSRASYRINDEEQASLGHVTSHRLKSSGSAGQKSDVLDNVDTDYSQGRYQRSNSGQRVMGVIGRQSVLNATPPRPNKTLTSSGSPIAESSSRLRRNSSNIMPGQGVFTPPRNPRNSASSQSPISDSESRLKRSNSGVAFGTSAIPTTPRSIPDRDRSNSISKSPVSGQSRRMSIASESPNSVEKKSSKLPQKVTQADANDEAKKPIFKMRPKTPTGSITEAASHLNKSRHARLLKGSSSVASLPNDVTNQTERPANRGAKIKTKKEQSDTLPGVTGRKNNDRGIATHTGSSHSLFAQQDENYDSPSQAQRPALQERETEVKPYKDYQRSAMASTLAYNDLVNSSDDSFDSPSQPVLSPVNHDRPNGSRRSDSAQLQGFKNPRKLRPAQGFDDVSEMNRTQHYDDNGKSLTGGFSPSQMASSSSVYQPRNDKEKLHSKSSARFLENQEHKKPSPDNRDPQKSTQRTVTNSAAQTDPIFEQSAALLNDTNREIQQDLSSPSTYELGEEEMPTKKEIAEAKAKAEAKSKLISELLTKLSGETKENLTGGSTDRYVLSSVVSRKLTALADRFSSDTYLQENYHLHAEIKKVQKKLEALQSQIDVTNGVTQLLEPDVNLFEEFTRLQAAEKKLLALTSTPQISETEQRELTNLREIVKNQQQALDDAEKERAKEENRQKGAVHLVNDSIKKVTDLEASHATELAQLKAAHQNAIAQVEKDKDAAIKLSDGASAVLVQKHNTIVEGLRQEIEALHKENQTGKKTIQELQDSLSQNAESETSQIALLQQQVALSSKTQQELQDKVGELQSQERAQSSIIRSAKTLIQNSEALFPGKEFSQDTSEALGEITLAMQEANSESQSKLTQAETLNEAFNDLNKALSTALGIKPGERLEINEATLRSLEEKISKGIAASRNDSASYDLLKASFNSAKASLATLAEQVQPGLSGPDRLQHSIESPAGFAKVLDTLRGKVERQQQAIAGEKAKHQEQTDALSNLATNIGRLLKDNTSISDAFSKIDGKKSTSTAANVTKTNALNDFVSSQLDSTRVTTPVSTRRNSGTDADANHQNEILLAKLNDEKTKLQKQLEQTEADKQELRAKYNAMRTAKNTLEDDNLSAVREKEDAIASKAALEKKYAEKLQAQEKDALARIQNLRNKLREKNTAVTDNAEQEELNQRISDLELENARYADQFGVLKDRNGTLKGENQALSAENKELRRQLAEKGPSQEASSQAVPIIRHHRPPTDNDSGRHAIRRARGGRVQVPSSSAIPRDDSRRQLQPAMDLSKAELSALNTLFTRTQLPNQINQFQTEEGTIKVALLNEVEFSGDKSNLLAIVQNNYTKSRILSSALTADIVSSTITKIKNCADIETGQDTIGSFLKGLELEDIIQQKDAQSYTTLPSVRPTPPTSEAPSKSYVNATRHGRKPLFGPVSSSSEPVNKTGR